MAKATKATNGKATKGGAVAKIAKMRSWLPMFEKRIKEAETRIKRTQERKAMVLDQIRKLEAQGKPKGGAKKQASKAQPAKPVVPAAPAQAA